MRLFTSNSNCQEIFKICVYTVLVAFFYYGIVSLVPKDLKGANQWQTNLIKVQDFVFDNKAYTHAFVGSSEAYNIPVDEISDKWANLGFASGCSLTGLEVILRSGKPIDVVVVEVNETLLRGQDDGVLSEITPWHKFPMGRQNTRLDYLLNLSKTKIKKYVKNENNIVKDEDELPKPSALAQQQEKMAGALDEEAMCQVLTQLKSQINTLQQQGVRVILAETPNDPSLYYLQRPKGARNFIHDFFPLDQYEYYEVDWNDYKTNDGIHLTNFSARQYAKRIVEKF